MTNKVQGLWKGAWLYMKKRKSRPGMQKERMGIIAASVFVLSALTLTGVYIASQDDSKQEENLIDFAQLEQQNKKTNEEKQIADNRFGKEENSNDSIISENNDMDVDPNFTEVNSGKVENERPRFTRDENEKKEETVVSQEEIKQVETPKLTFDEKTNLQWPIVGKVLLGYSMDKAIYFPTMQQYRYNPSIVIAANVGETITAAADGKVKSVYDDPRTGKTIVFELGNGYELTYGQLNDIKLKKGQYVKAGDIVGKVADPTIYYSEEGSNVYFMLTKDQTPLNPLEILKQIVITAKYVYNYNVLKLPDHRETTYFKGNKREKKDTQSSISSVDRTNGMC